MKVKDWDAFCDHVHVNTALEEELIDIEDQDRFIARTLEIAAQAGFDLSIAEIKGRIQQSRREWFERSLPQ
jgi:hypothetical protein